MKTQFPYTEKIDFGAYIDKYLEREDAIKRLPTEEELLELARKSIVREQLVLAPLPDGTAAEEGDTAVLMTESDIPKFNKPSVTVTLGRGFYNRDLEAAVIGLKAGETASVTVGDQPVKATVLALKRKQVPDPTDEMVKALGQKDLKGNPINTVEEYEAYIREQKTLETLFNICYYVMEDILGDYKVEDFDEDDIRILGELEADNFKKLFLEKEGIDLEKEVPQGWRDQGVNSLEEFIKARYDWYKVKITQCLIYLNILDLPCEGRTDPTDHYEVLSELQMKVIELIKEELERRN
ncbi:MAG: hypothetical protein J5854_00470 [Clostridia bacterium]|nr:hypothetical protein [Clostridia bacterium]